MSTGPGRVELNFGWLTFKIMSLDLTDDKSTLVQEMAWFLQATSHYLGQSSRRSVSPYGVIRPQLVELMSIGTQKNIFDHCDKDFQTLTCYIITGDPLHNLTAHRRAAHNPAARWCAGSVVCNLSRQRARQQCRLAQRWPNVGTIVPTLGQRWSNLGCCLTG